MLTFFVVIHEAGHYFVAKKCGMNYTGTIKDKYTKDGILHSADRYTVTREQYLTYKNGNTQIY